ncbi:MAG: YfdX family protein [Gammaproteobacteria bacterium]|nr:YfdX family protein [Gammaproteobacteria bacterium]
MNSTVKISAVTLFLLANTAFGTTAVMAATPTPSQAPVAVTTASVPTALSLEQEQIHQADALAQKAREAMSYIVAARQLLSEQHGEEAHQYLEQAKGLLTKLKSEVPAGDENGPALVSIYSQMGIKKGVEITEQLKQQLGKTHLDVVRGNHKKVVEALKTVDIELQYSFVDLPVVATLGKVESALKLLSTKNTQEAGKILDDAEAGLIHDSIIVNSVNENPVG